MNFAVRLSQIEHFKASNLVVGQALSSENARNSQSKKMNFQRSPYKTLLDSLRFGKISYDLLWFLMIPYDALVIRDDSGRSTIATLALAIHRWAKLHNNASQIEDLSVLNRISRCPPNSSRWSFGSFEVFNFQLLIPSLTTFRLPSRVLK